MNFALLILTAICNITQAQDKRCIHTSLTRLVCLCLAKKLISFAENVMLFYVLSLYDFTVMVAQYTILSHLILFATDIYMWQLLEE
jgi:hypothetical protein